MANWNNPTLTSTYVNFVAEVKGRDDDLARGMDPAFATVTNPPTNAIRWSSAISRWQRWNGTAWEDLSTTYAINVTGNAATVTNGVYTTGDQTIGGVKTFSSQIVGATNSQVSLTGDQTIAGVKTFSSQIVGATNSQVSLTGDQTIAGVKTFSQPIAGATNSQVSLTGYQTIGGIKTFGESPRIRNSNPTLFLQDTDSMSAMLHCNNNLFYVLRGGVDSTTWEQINGQWPLTVNLANNDVNVGGNFTASGNVTAARGQFIGNGAGLTNVTATNATNVTGTAGQLGFSVNSTIGFNGRGGPEVTGQGGGAAAMMCFHRPGHFAVNFGLDGHDIAVGGWSFGNVSRRILHEGNWRGIIGAAHVGEVGTYAFLRPNNDTDYWPGATLAGSSLRYSGGLTGARGGGNFAEDGAAPAGTWRCMGSRVAREHSDVGLLSSSRAATLWLRIS